MARETEIEGDAREIGTGARQLFERETQPELEAILVHCGAGALPEYSAQMKCRHTEARREPIERHMLGY